MNSSYMQPWFNPLASEFRLIWHEQTKSDLKALAQDCADKIILNGPTHVVAHSWGSFLLLYALDQNPDAAKSLKSSVLISPMALTDINAKESMQRVQKLFSGEDLEKLNALHDRYDNHSAQELMKIVTPYYHYNSEFDMGIPAFDKRFWREINDQIKTFDLRYTVSNLPEKSLLIYGEADFAQPDPEYEQLQISIIPQAGHYPFAERQAYTLATIRSFCLAA